MSDDDLLGLFDDDPPDWWILDEPPSPGWRLGSRSAVHLDGGSWRDLDFLLPDKDDLKQLMVKATIEDISALNELHALERLVLFPDGRPSGSLDLACLPRLRELHVLGSVPTEIPDGHELNWLQVEELQRPMANTLTRLSHLEVLRLTAPRTVPVTYPASLRQLDIAHVTKWDKNVGVLHGIASLGDLFLNKIRGMRNLAAFAEASGLERLYAEDCDELVSVEGPVLASNAQWLFVGRTPLRRTMPERWEDPE